VDVRQVHGFDKRPGLQRTVTDACGIAIAEGHSEIKLWKDNRTTAWARGSCLQPAAARCDMDAGENPGKEVAATRFAEPAHDAQGLGCVRVKAGA